MAAIDKTSLLVVLIAFKEEGTSYLWTRLYDKCWKVSVLTLWGMLSLHLLNRMCLIQNKYQTVLIRVQICRTRKIFAVQKISTEQNVSDSQEHVQSSGGWGVTGYQRGCKMFGSAVCGVVIFQRNLGRLRWPVLRLCCEMLVRQHASRL